MCLARLIRCAMVASGTRNARAISAVVKPPMARKVNAIAEASVSARWQHMKTTFSTSNHEVSRRNPPAPCNPVGRSVTVSAPAWVSCLRPSATMSASVVAERRTASSTVGVLTS